MTDLATDVMHIEARARALRAAYIRSLAVGLVARLRRRPMPKPAHA